MPGSPFLEAKRAGYRAQRSASKGASITLVSGCGEWKASFECATRAAEVLGDRDLQELGDGIFESIPVLHVPLETLHENLTKLTARYSVALVDLFCGDGNSSFVLIWKIDQRMPSGEPLQTSQTSELENKINEL